MHEKGKGKDGFDRIERREHKAGNLNRRWAQMGKQDGELNYGRSTPRLAGG